MADGHAARPSLLEMDDEPRINATAAEPGTVPTAACIRNVFKMISDDSSGRFTNLRIPARFLLWIGQPLAAAVVASAIKPTSGGEDGIARDIVAAASAAAGAASAAAGASDDSEDADADAVRGLVLCGGLGWRNPMVRVELVQGWDMIWRRSEFMFHLDQNTPGGSGLRRGYTWGGDAEVMLGSPRTCGNFDCGCDLSVIVAVAAAIEAARSGPVSAAALASATMLGRTAACLTAASPATMLGLIDAGIAEEWFPAEIAFALAVAAMVRARAIGYRPEYGSPAAPALADRLAARFVDENTHVLVLPPVIV